MQPAIAKGRYVDTKGEKILFTCNDFDCFWIGDNPEVITQDGEWWAWCPVCGSLTSMTKEV